MHYRQPRCGRLRDLEPCISRYTDVFVYALDELCDYVVSTLGQNQEPDRFRQCCVLHRKQYQWQQPADIPHRAPAEVWDRRTGQYSAVSAMAFGIAPPSPRPVIKRKMRSWVSFVEVAVTMVKTPNIVVQIITTQRRPTLSATGPNRSAPINRPTRLAT